MNKTKLSLHVLGSIAAMVAAYTLALCFPGRLTVLLCLAASVYLAMTAGAVCAFCAEHERDDDDL